MQRHYLKLFNKKRKRWFLVINDSSNSYRVAISSQCFHLFENNVIQKGDTIYVKSYAVTKLYKDIPRLLFLTDILKVKNE